MNKLSPLFSAVAITSLGLVSLGFLGFPALAHAELVISSSKAPTPKIVAPVPASSVTSPLSTIDKSNYLPSWGYNVPLGSAVFQIIPAGYAVKFSPKVDLKQIVSWQGGVAWQSALTGMLSSHGLIAIIEPANHQIKVDVRDLSANPSIPVTTTVSTVPVSPAPISAPSAPVSSPSFTWVLNPALTLKQNIIAWAKQAGWHVEWNAVDYPVVAKVDFHGAFDANNGPIATIIGAYKQASQPLTARLTTMDHVVYVENTTFQPQVVLPISGNANADALFHDNSVYGPKFNSYSGDPNQTTINAPDKPYAPSVPAYSEPLPAPPSTADKTVSEHFSAPPAGFSVSTDHPAVVSPIANSQSNLGQPKLGQPVVITPQSINPPVNQLNNPNQ